MCVCEITGIGINVWRGMLGWGRVGGAVEGKSEETKKGLGEGIIF